MLPFRVKQQKMIVKTGKFSVLVGMRRSTKQQSGEFQVRAESLWLNSQIKCVAAAHNYKIRKNAGVQMKRHANWRASSGNLRRSRCMTRTGAAAAPVLQLKFIWMTVFTPLETAP